MDYKVLKFGFLIMVVYFDLKRNMFYCRVYKYLIIKGMIIGILMRVKRFIS